MRDLWDLHPLVVGGEETPDSWPGPVLRVEGLVREESPIDTVQTGQT